MRTGEPEGEPLKHPAAVGFALFSPDGRTLLSICNADLAVSEIRLWDVQEHREIAKPLPFRSMNNNVAFSRDSKLLAIADDLGGIRLVDPRTGRLVAPQVNHRNSVTKVAFSPDGQVLATSSLDHTARLWETKTGEPLSAPLDHPSDVYDLTFSPDGSVLATAGNERPRLWLVCDGSPITASKNR